MRQLFLFLFLALCCHLSQAQTLSGRTISERNAGASAVNIRFANGANKVITDDLGNFSITAKNLPDTLIFESPGIEAYKVIITEAMLKDPNFEVVLLDKRSYNEAYRESKYLDSGATLSEVVISSPAPRKRKSEKLSKKVTAAEIRTAPGEKYTPVSGDVAPEMPVAYATDEAVRARLERPEVLMVNGKSFIWADTASAAASPVFKRQMTAGEVNDLFKWSLWSDLSENDFASLRGNQLNFTHRYSVQVTHKDGSPAIGTTVRLYPGETKKAQIEKAVWTAVTDNTGKAELWAAAFPKDSLLGSYAIAIDDMPLQPAIRFELGMNHIKTKQKCEAVEGVELAFVVDATGSMSDEINFLKLELESVITSTFSRLGEGGLLRFASVFYRDQGDEYVTLPFNFNNNLLKVLNFIKVQGADGGGDTPEAMFEAIEAAIALDWTVTSRTRIIFVVADAPPHMEVYDRLAALTQSAAAKGIRIVPIGCSGADLSNEHIMRSLALGTNGTYLSVTNHSGIGSDHAEPVTDSYRVELLGDLMERIILDYSLAFDCNATYDSLQQQNLRPQYRQNPAQLKASPNPTNGPVRLTIETEITDLYLCDFSGKILQKLTPPLREKTLDVDLGQYPSGMYLFSYLDKNNKPGAVQVVLQR